MVDTRARLVRVLLTAAGWLGRWLLGKLGRMGLAALEAWMEGEIDKFEDKGRSARGARRRRWYMWRSRLWRRALRRLRSESAGLLGRAIDDIIEAAEARAKNIESKPDSYRRWRERGEP